MSKNTKKTSSRVASIASEMLLSPRTSTLEKSLAASALAQRAGSKQTGASTEDKASRVMRSAGSSDHAKEVAASVLSQSNKQR